MNSTKPNDISMGQSFFKALKDLVSTYSSPKVFMKIGKNEDFIIEYGDTIQNSNNSFELLITDIEIAKMFFPEINFIYSGHTGSGKSYTIELIATILFGVDGYLRDDLGSNPLGKNALTPFLKYDIDSGVLDLNVDALNRYSMIFLDEINTGDFNEIRQLVDGKIKINGKFGQLSMPGSNHERVKGIHICGAMNPVGSLYTHAEEMSFAAIDRFVIIHYPEKLEALVEDLLLIETPNDNITDVFWGSIQSKFGFKDSRQDFYTGLISLINETSLVSSSAKEFLSLLFYYFFDNPDKFIEDNAQLCLKYLDKSLHQRIRSKNEIDRVSSIKSKIFGGLTMRDPLKIIQLAKLINFIRNSSSDNTATVSINDVGYAFFIVVHGKMKEPDNPDLLISAITDAVKSYRSIRTRTRMESVSFDQGIKREIIASAIYSYTNYNFEGFMNSLFLAFDSLNITSIGYGESMILSKLCTDLSVLIKFTQIFQDDIALLLSESHESRLQENLNTFFNDRKNISVEYRQHLIGFFD